MLSGSQEENYRKTAESPYFGSPAPPPSMLGSRAHIETPKPRHSRRDGPLRGAPEKKMEGRWKGNSTLSRPLLSCRSAHRCLADTRGMARLAVGFHDPIQKGETLPTPRPAAYARACVQKSTNFFGEKEPKRKSAVSGQPT